MASRGVLVVPVVLAGVLLAGCGGDSVDPVVADVPSSSAAVSAPAGSAAPAPVSSAPAAPAPSTAVGSAPASSAPAPSTAVGSVPASPAPVSSAPAPVGSASASPAPSGGSQAPASGQPAQPNGLPPEQLSVEGDIIVAGTFAEVNGTKVTLKVTEVLRGAAKPGDTLTVEAGDVLPAAGMTGVWGIRAGASPVLLFGATDPKVIANIRASVAGSSAPAASPAAS